MPSKTGSKRVGRIVTTLLHRRTRNEVPSSPGDGETAGSYVRAAASRHMLNLRIAKVAL